MEYLLYALVVYCIFAPPRYDLAIRVKERQINGSWKWPY